MEEKLVAEGTYPRLWVREGSPGEKGRGLQSEQEQATKAGERENSRQRQDSAVGRFWNERSCSRPRVCGLWRKEGGMASREAARVERGRCSPTLWDLMDLRLCPGSSGYALGRAVRGPLVTVWRTGWKGMRMEMGRQGGRCRDRWTGGTDRIEL